MAGSTPDPLRRRFFVLSYFSGTGCSSVRTVYLTGEHFGIIIPYFFFNETDDNISHECGKLNLKTCFVESFIRMHFYFFLESFICMHYIYTRIQINQIATEFMNAYIQWPLTKLYKITFNKLKY